MLDSLGNDGRSTAILLTLDEANYTRVGWRASPGIVLRAGRDSLRRRAAINWVASLAGRGILDMEDATEMAQESFYRPAKRAYRFDSRRPARHEQV